MNRCFISTAHRFDASKLFRDGQFRFPYPLVALVDLKFAVGYPLGYEEIQ